MQLRTRRTTSNSCCRLEIPRPNPRAQSLCRGNAGLSGLRGDQRSRVSGESIRGKHRRAVSNQGPPMAAMPVLVIGLDAAWRSRMQRLLAMRGEFDWLGAYAPGQPRETPNGQPALLLLDGDDPTVERERRKPQLPAPRRLYFYRHPNVSALQHCVESQGH